MTSVQGISAGNYLNGRIDFNQWLTNANTSNSIYDDNTILENSDGFVSESGERCTDGKDDGKIGLFSKIGHAIKGVGKTIVNGVKGMFTNKEGKFSLGKTLLSIGTIAASVAFPAVGVALCVGGAVAGTVQVAKGISAASKATTDAEAKEAWQNIGGGAFTVATSVAGAKAGIKSMKNTSTAALEAKGLTGDALKSAAKEAKAAGKDTSAFGNLAENATVKQKIGALGKDAVSSTKNRALQIKDTISTYKGTPESESVTKTKQQTPSKDNAIKENDRLLENNNKNNETLRLEEKNTEVNKNQNNKSINNPKGNKTKIDIENEAKQILENDELYRKLKNCKRNAEDYKTSNKIYHQLMRKYHPDINTTLDESVSQSISVMINELQPTRKVA